MAVNTFRWERYECDSCDKVVEADSDEREQVQFEWDWQCPDCNKPFTIYAKNDSETIKIILKRKKARTLQVGEFVLINIVGDTMNQHEIAKIDTKSNKGKVAVRLLGHKWEIYTPDKIVNCVIGDWHDITFD